MCKNAFTHAKEVRCVITFVRCSIDKRKDTLKRPGRAVSFYPHFKSLRSRNIGLCLGWQQWMCFKGTKETYMLHELFINKMF